MALCPALAMCGIGALLAGCSGSVTVGGTSTVDQSGEVSYAQAYISHQLPDLPATKSVDCPSNVDPKAGNTFECHATLANGQEVTLPFRIAAVPGDHVRFAPNYAQVSQALAVEVLYKGGAGLGVQSVECPTGVPATVGKTFECRARLKGGRSASVTLRVDKATSTDQNLQAVHAS